MHHTSSSHLLIRQKGFDMMHSSLQANKVNISSSKLVDTAAPAAKV